MLRRCSSPRATASFLAVAVLTILTSSLFGHPGSSIVADAKGNLYFVDTGQGVWKLDPSGKLTLIHSAAYHWMALDENVGFGKSNSLGEFDGGTFELITPAATIPALIISSDYPIAVAADGALYFVPFQPKGPRELIRRDPSGRRSVFAQLPASANGTMQWINGIAQGPEGSLYITDNDAIHKVDRSGKISVIRAGISAPECKQPLAGVPQLPYLRGIAAHSNGTIYVAANGCRSVIAVPAQGPVRTVLTAEAPWAPTGVTTAGNDLYVLEYRHTSGDDRKEWTPRVRKIAENGKITTLAEIKRDKP